MVFWRASQFGPFFRQFSADATKFAEKSGQQLKEVGLVLRYIGSGVREFAETNPKMDDIFVFCILGTMAWSLSRNPRNRG